MKKRLMSLLVILSMVLAMVQVAAFAAENTIVDGWYYLRTMNNYLNLTSDGKAELRKLSENTAFYVENAGTGLTGHDFVTLKMTNGKYLGVSADLKNGARVVAVSQPYKWTITWEKKSEIFSLRLPEYTNMLLNASGGSNKDGTAVTI